MSEKRYTGTPKAPIARVEKRDDGKPLIVGYGAVFYDPSNPGTEYDLRSSWGGFVERIMPGAFDQAIRNDDVRALFNHDVNEILGRSGAGTLRLSVDKVGLRYEIDPPDTAAAEKVVKALERGDITGSSFSFNVDEQTWRDVKNETTGDLTTIRELTKVSLFDLGPVTFPAYEATSAGMRSGSDLEESRTAFEAHKNANIEAKRMADAVDVDAWEIEMASG